MLRETLYRLRCEQMRPKTSFGLVENFLKTTAPPRRYSKGGQKLLWDVGRFGAPIGAGLGLAHLLGLTGKSVNPAVEQVRQEANIAAQQIRPGLPLTAWK